MGGKKLATGWNNVGMCLHAGGPRVLFYELKKKKVCLNLKYRPATFLGWGLWMGLIGLASPPLSCSVNFLGSSSTTSGAGVTRSGTGCKIFGSYKRIIFLKESLQNIFCYHIWHAE